MLEGVVAVCCKAFTKIKHAQKWTYALHVLRDLETLVAGWNCAVRVWKLFTIDMGSPMGADWNMVMQGGGPQK